MSFYSTSTSTTSTTPPTRNHNNLRISGSSGPSSRRSTPTSSGAVTPTTTDTVPPTPNSGGSLSSYLWNGLFRRFSSDPTSPKQQSSVPAYHHTSSMPVHRSSYFDGGYAPAPPPPLSKSHSVSLQRTSSPFLPSLEPLQLQGFSPRTPESARLMTIAIAEEIRIMVPARLSLVDEWNLAYSLEQDGASLATLYDKCRKYAGKRVGFVLCVRDCEGGIFGAYLSDIPHPAPNYFGTGECFLWRASVMAGLPPPPSVIDESERAAAAAGDGGGGGDGVAPPVRSATIAAPPSAQQQQHLNGNGHNHPGGGVVGSIRFKAFPYSGVNEYYMLCEQHFISVGAGDGKFGLWLDDGLERGLSSVSQTFGNEPLSDEGEKFGVSGVELWVIGA